MHWTGEKGIPIVKQGTENGNFPKYEEENGSSSKLVLQEDTENSMGGVNKQWGSLILRIRKRRLR